MSLLASFTVNLADPPHFLYRHYDRNGDLLYTGVTKSPGTRFADGPRSPRRGKWWHEIATTHVDAFPNKCEAKEAEDRAIRRERPKYNIAGQEE